MSSDARNASVLVVEDNPEARMLMEDFLASLDQGYQVSVATTGQQALDMFESQPGTVDLVLMDMMLPDIGGAEVCQRIKATDAGRLTPVIMVTARDDTSSKVHGLERGADDYVTKPINFQELEARIRAMLRIRSQNLELVRQSAGATARSEEVRKLLEQASKLSDIGAMVSEVIHEINNPLNGIMNYTDILAERGLEDDEDVRELVDVIRSEAERIHKLVESLLTFRRSGATMERVDLGKVLEHTLTISKYILGKSGVEVQREFEAGDHFVSADSSKLVQVFLNLIHNAIHAMDAKVGGEGKKTLCVKLASTRDGELFVSIRDNGTGIAPEALKHIFDTDFSTKGPGEGTGLGLNIVDGIVREHSGRIQVSSEPGNHTEFKVFLPVGSR